MLYLWLSVAFLFLVCVWLHNRLTIAETRLQLLSQMFRAPHLQMPLPTPQDAASENGTAPIAPAFTPYPEFRSVWDNPVFPVRQRPNVPKEDKAGKERDTQEQLKLKREPVPYGFRDGGEARPIE